MQGSVFTFVPYAQGIVAARDPHGFRPLVLGEIDGSYVVASETCAFELIGADHIREIEPGEIVFINEKGIRSFKPLPKKQHKYCVFENIYFSRPDSFLHGKNIYQMRKDMGRQLAIECPCRRRHSRRCSGFGNARGHGICRAAGNPL